MHSLDLQTLSASLFTQEALSALSDADYQQLTALLFSAPLPVRLDCAETLFRYNRETQSRSLGAFLACVVPSAHDLAQRLTANRFPTPADLTTELFFHGAVNAAVKFFQTGHIPDQVVFPRALARTLKSGAIRAAYHRAEQRAIFANGSLPLHRACSPIEDQIIARDLLSKLTAFEPDPATARIHRFIQCLVDLGAEQILRPRAQHRKENFLLDLQPVMDHLGISLSTARHYLVDARVVLSQLFNPDGTLFTRAR